MDIPLLDVIDQEILMHRDAHFGSKFDIMLEYYREDGVGCMPDFSLKRIEHLRQIQDEISEDLAMKVLPMPAVEQVQRSKDLYKKFREVYSGNNVVAKKLSDLILSEDEEAKAEIDAIIKEGKSAVDPLIHLIDSDQFYDPINPGYGRAPLLAAKALAKIGDPKAISHLFNALGQENFSIDEALISALISFREAAKEFLFKRLTHKPFSSENEHAAIVLSSFPPDEEIAKVSLSLLMQEDVQKLENLSSYLTCASEGLQSHQDRLIIKTLSEKESLSANLRNELSMLLRIWQFETPISSNSDK